MITGARSVNKSLNDVKEKLKTIFAGANCEIKEEANDTIRFIHGTYFTQTPLLYRKNGTIKLREEQNKVNIEYEIDIALFLRIWFTTIGILFCWTIFAPIAAYRVLAVYPRKFIENIVAGI